MHLLDFNALGAVSAWTVDRRRSYRVAHKVRPSPCARCGALEHIFTVPIDARRVMGFVSSSDSLHAVELRACSSRYEICVRNSETGICRTVSKRCAMPCHAMLLSTAPMTYPLRSWPLSHLPQALRLPCLGHSDRNALVALLGTATLRDCIGDSCKHRTVAVRTALNRIGFRSTDGAAPCMR